MSKDTPQKVAPKLVTLGKALQLAESWVNNMSGSTMNESTEVENEGRPSRLGLGSTAKVLRHSKLETSTDPVERKLRAKLDTEKRRAAKNMEESILSERNGGCSDEDDENLESRTNAFGKKRVGHEASLLQAKKKRK
uniref:Uncharacterized protein n=1 Tax=Nelumbo nucifera TaxID=4432 RepID=A0A822ZR56_NELNU|nr:TPA_asm: hypothetical protein HUJ06_017290 [Nelumbo nucifera]